MEYNENGERVYLEMGKDPKKHRNDGSGGDWVGELLLADAAGASVSIGIGTIVRGGAAFLATFIETGGFSLGPAIIAGASASTLGALEMGGVTSALDAAAGRPLGKHIKGWIRKWGKDNKGKGK